MTEESVHLSNKELEIVFQDVILHPAEVYSRKVFEGFDEKRLLLLEELITKARTSNFPECISVRPEDYKIGFSHSLELTFVCPDLLLKREIFHFFQLLDECGLEIKKMKAAYIGKNKLFCLVCDLSGKNNQEAWEVVDVQRLVLELIYAKDFGVFSSNLKKRARSLEELFFFEAMTKFLFLTSFEETDEHFRKEELLNKFFMLFEYRFHPVKQNIEAYKLLKDVLESQLENDHYLMLALDFIDSCLKTNFFLFRKKALSFRLDPKFLRKLPKQVREKFKVKHEPFGIFFIYAENSFGFHIRFQDIARGGLRTVVPKNKKESLQYAKGIFYECYDLSFTQQLKNKDIPEGGAKGIIFLERQDDQLIVEKRDAFAFRKEALFRAQKSFIEALLDIVNCDPDGALKEKNIVDYLKKPEYLYLGPDENMHDEMIEWIAEYSKKVGYGPGIAFITSKPKSGINHKQYGVTSWGITVCLERVLDYLGIDPKKKTFSVKMTGGPDGDVAGNQILNFYKYYPKTSKLLTLVDVSGIIFDPNGLDLKELSRLFELAKPIRFYPKEKLSEEGFLFVKEEGKLNGKKLTDDEVHEIEKHIHKTYADIFIPAGGRPKTLSEQNFHDYLDARSKPTSLAIIEGANVYLSDQARKILQEKGLVIIKDSSANKGGVICSSFEVLASTLLTENEFIENKEQIVKQILDRIKLCAEQEVDLILKTHQEKKFIYTEISDLISERINGYCQEILKLLEGVRVEENAHLMAILEKYVLPILREKFKDRLEKKIPENYKKAIIATQIASQLVYEKGLEVGPLTPEILSK